MIRLSRIYSPTNVSHDEEKRNHLEHDKDDEPDGSSSAGSGTGEVDPEISVIYENNLADASLKRIGKKLRFQFESLVKLHNKITPKEVVKERKEFRKALFIRNNYTEMLNILQANVMNKLTNKKYKNLDKKFLEDALMTSIAGISAAMKNTG